MERKKIDFRIRTLGISRSQVAALTGISRSDLANFLNERGNLSARKTQGLLNTLAALEAGVAELQREYPGFSFNLKDMDFVSRLIAVMAGQIATEKFATDIAQQETDRAGGTAKSAWRSGQRF